MKNLAERLVVRGRKTLVEGSDLHPLILNRVPKQTGIAGAVPTSKVDLLVSQMFTHGESFWNAVHAPFLKHDLTRDDLRLIVQRGLESTSGNYRDLLEQFNMPSRDYRRFLNFLRKYDSQPPSKPGSSVDADVVLPGAGDRTAKAVLSSSRERKHAS